MTDGSADRLLEQAFRDFYACLSDLGGEVEADPWHFTKRAGDTPEEQAEARQQAARRIRTRLKTFLQEQAAELARLMGSEGARKLDEAQYVMAALADEVFVNFEWEGREAWSHELLETSLFGSHVSGERVFERAEALLNKGDEADPELAFVYLSAISLGFLGRYRGAADDGALRSVRRRLLTFVTRGRSTLADDMEPLFPQALDHTLVSSEHLRLPPVRRWATIFAILVAAYLVGAHFVWVDVSEGLWQVGRDMAETTSRAGSTVP